MVFILLPSFLFIKKLLILNMHFVIRSAVYYVRSIIEKWHVEMPGRFNSRVYGGQNVWFFNLPFLKPVHVFYFN